MENATKTTLTSVAGQVGHALNNTASQFAAHSTTVEAAGLPVAAAFGFMPGLMLGLKEDRSCFSKLNEYLEGWQNPF